MKVKLKEIADVIAGQSPASKYYSDCDGFPFLQGNRTFRDRYPLIDSFTSKITKVADAGDVLISVRAPVGDINIAPCDLCIGRGLAAIKAKDGDNAFLYYALKQNVRTLTKRGNGTTYDSVDADTLQNLDLLIPEKEDLRAYIARLLNALDDSIENNSSIRSDLEAAAKLLYDYWFVQFDFPDENGRPYKSSGGKMVWNDELKREIPEGWACKRLDEIASLINNQINPSSDTDYLHFSIPAFDEGRTPSLENGDGIESNKFSLPGKCILVSKLNPQFQRVWLVIDERANKISSTEFLPFVPKKTCSYELLYEILRSDAFYAYMCNCSSSSTGSRKRMPPELCLEYKIAFPKEDSDLLERFQTATASTLSYLAKIPGESKRLAELRDFLLPLLMNGQVTIGDGGK